MMDPLTAIGLVSNIISFIDFSLGLLSGAREIHDSLSGTLEQNRSRGAVVGEMKKFSAKLLAPDASNLAAEDKELCILATECRTLSSQLVDLLEKNKPKDPKSKSQSLLSALKNKIHEKEVQDLEQRLDYCRSQLELQLNFFGRREISARLETLVEASKGDASKLERLQSHMDQLRQGVEVAFLSPEALTQIRQLVCVQEEALNSIAQDRILRSLEFDGMHGRYDMVHEASSDTFQWILDNGDQSIEEHRVQKNHRPSQDQIKSLARELFINWLSSGEGIFHLSGKLGCGKSTLMKFLCDHPRTEIELGKWAGERTLVFTNFFFWAPGSERQKSLSGLYCALLYDILKSCPELIPQVLPNYWNKALSAPWQVQTLFNIPDKEIRIALTQLIKNRNVGEKHCFCFFIDGLDEFQETSQDDHKAMVDLLRLWTTSLPGRVKICVSSREYNVFMNAFSPTTRLRLHDLTRRDMRNYVRDKLSHVPDEERGKWLIDAITDKAQGIFLWVTLVVKSMREQLENGYTIAALVKELDTLPDELEGLFRHILRSLPRVARKNAYRTLAMLTLLKKYEDLQLSLLAYSFLGEYEQDPEFAMNSGFLQSGLGGITREDRVKLAGKRLVGWCRGLVEWDGASNLEYTHRSVSEFLETATIEAEIVSLTNGFNCAEAISQLVLADLRLHDWRSPSLPPVLVSTLIRLRHDKGLDRPPFAFLNYLESILKPEPSEDLEKKNDVYEIFMIADQNSHWRICTFWNQHCDAGYEIKFILEPLYIATFLGYHEYPTWKVLHDLTTGDDVLRIVFLAYCCMDIRRVSGEHGWPVNVSVLHLLLDRGLLSPNTKTHLWSCLDPSPQPEADTQLSIWQHYLLYLAAEYDIDGTKAEIWDGQILEAFLLHKPDLDFTLSIKGPPLNALHMELKLGKEQKIIRVPRSGLMNFVARQYNNLSPREWIERTSLDNKERLLQLVDSRMEELKSDKEKEIVNFSNMEPHVDQTDRLKDVDQGPDQPSISQPSEPSTHQNMEDCKLLSDHESTRSSSMPSHIEQKKYFFIIVSGVLIALLILYL
ncbi:hypothetical protein N431DRAFT_181433 [Stipitochalara longipes BDJ]|nr:hypothetical protein N431DRAFT_181433 [Stipitochalara longipes BDJ]